MGCQVDLITAGLSNDAVHVAGRNASAGQNLNAALGICNHFPDGIGTHGDVGLLAAGQHTGNTQINQFVEDGFPVGHHINGPVEHRFLTGILGHLGQDFGALPVQGTVLVQEAEDQTIGAVGQQQLGIFDGRCKLGVGIAKTAFPRTHHGHNLHIGLPLGHQKLTDGGSQTAMKQIAVQFHTVCACLMSLNDIIGAAAADFQNYLTHCFITYNNQSCLLRPAKVRPQNCTNARIYRSMAMCWSCCSTAMEISP